MSKQIITTFISHNSADKKFAKKLSSDLQSQGISVWLDEWVMRGGESLSDMVQNGISISDVFIIILSENSINSPWVQEELRAAFQRRFNQKKHFVIIPLMLEECTIPLFLQDYLYISFINSRKYKESLNKLCDSIIFRDEFINRYRAVYSGGFIVDNIAVTAQVSGPNQEDIYFHEKYLITPTKKIKHINKQFAHDGRIIDVSLSSGTVNRKRIRKSTEKWTLEHRLEMLPKENQSFRLTYHLQNEFRLANSWFYTIDAPTRLFEFKFIFGNECVPKFFKVHFMQTQTRIFEKVIKPKKAKEGIMYRFKQPFPNYKDWFEFVWD